MFCGASEMLAVVVLPEVIATLVSGAGAKPSGAVSSRMVYVPAGSNGLLAVFPSGPVVSWLRATLLVVYAKHGSLQRIAAIAFADRRIGGSFDHFKGIRRSSS